MVSIDSFFSRHIRHPPSLAVGAEGLTLIFLFYRQEKAEKVEKEESSAQENQRRLPNHDQHELGFR